MLAHHGLIPALFVAEPRKPSPTNPEGNPEYVREVITHEELYAAYGGCIYGLWDFFKGF